MITLRLVAPHGDIFLNLSVGVVGGFPFCRRLVGRTSVACVGTGGSEEAAAPPGPRRGGQCSRGPQARSGTREGLLCRQSVLANPIKLSKVTQVGICFTFIFLFKIDVYKYVNHSFTLIIFPINGLCLGPGLRLKGPSLILLPLPTQPENSFFCHWNQEWNENEKKRYGERIAIAVCPMRPKAAGSVGRTSVGVRSSSVMLQISSDFENMSPELCEAEPATGPAWSAAQCCVWKRPPPQTVLGSNWRAAPATSLRTWSPECRLTEPAAGGRQWDRVTSCHDAGACRPRPAAAPGSALRRWPLAERWRMPRRAAWRLPET